MAATLAMAVLLATAGCQGADVTSSGGATAEGTSGPAQQSDAPDTPTSATSTPPASPELGDLTAALQSAGIEVTPDDDPEHGSGTITITTSQAAVWADQWQKGAGKTGRQLREMFGPDEDAIPVDALIAAWVTSSDGPAAAAARELMAPATIEDPQDARFPWAVVAMFIQDITSDSPGVIGGASSGFRAPTRAMAPASRLMPQAAPAEGSIDPCGKLSGLYESVIGTISSWFDTSGSDSTILAIAGEAVALFGEYLGKALSAALAPILAPIKAAIGALGVVTAVAGALVPWTAEISASPTEAAFGITPASGQEGRFTLTVSTPLPDWPIGVRSCASLIGVELPSISPSGSLVDWSFVGGSVATETAHDGTLSGDASAATLSYITGTETPEDATGSLLINPVIVGADVQRDTSALSKVLNKLLESTLFALPDIVVVLLSDVATDALSAVLGASGAATVSDPVPVTHHLAPPKDPPPGEQPPDTPPDPPESCVGTELVSQLNATVATGTTVIMPGAARLWLYDDHTGEIDFNHSTKFFADNASGTVRGTMTFTWSGGPTTFHTFGASGHLTARIKAGGVMNEVDLPVDSMTQEGETLLCKDGDITFQRTGWVFY